MNAPIAVFPPPDLKLEFRPFWNLKSNLLSTYGISPSSNWRGAARMGYASILPSNFSSDHTLALDKLLLHECVAALGSAGRSERSVLAITSLHATTLQHAGAASEIIECCNKIPAALRSRLLFEIVDVDRLIGWGEAYEKAILLSMLARGVLGRSSAIATNFSFFKAIRLTAVGVDFTGNTRGEASLIEELESFAVVAQRSNLVSYARGLNSMSLTIAAVGAGFGYIESMHLNRPDEDSALRLLPFQLNDLYGLPSDLWRVDTGS